MINYLKDQWHGVNDVELVRLEWVVIRAYLTFFEAKSILNRFLMLLRLNETRMHSAIGYMSPFEFERRYYDSLIESDKAA